MFDQDKIKQTFPILASQINNKPLVYLDNAATTQKPLQVIQAITDYYMHHNANIHRGVHTLSTKATDLYEGVRDKIKHHINASHSCEIVFCRGATEAINLVANAFLRPILKSGDEIIITAMEHHSNIVPWQMVADATGATIKVIPINDQGELILDELPKLLSKKTKLLAVSHISNALGTINPIKKIVEISHAHGVPVLVDGAQAMPHQIVDIAELDCDFYAFSGHKMYGPTGIGTLYAKQQYLEQMSPYQGGGDMIKYVSFAETQYNDIPYKFEAGTPNIAGVIGLGAAIDFLQDLEMDKIAHYEKQLLAYLTNKISVISGINIIGNAAQKAGILSFTLDNIHAHDIGTILDEQGIAIRAGHHCAMPIMQHFNVPATARVSLSFYNTKQDIDKFIDAIEIARGIFA